MRKIQLVTGEYIYPDIIDLTNRLVYEIHIKGERRREYFDKLPDGWKGIKKENPQTLVVKFD